jgi:hypothetical protein
MNLGYLVFLCSGHSNVKAYYVAGQVQGGGVEGLDAPLIRYVTYILATIPALN